MSNPSQRIILTGFMGAGKTTVAESIASLLDCQMIDLDALIVGREGKTISAIIDKYGEAKFREIETRNLIDALQFKNARVIALGGGTWTIEQNRTLIEEEKCTTVWLDAPFELCWQRINNENELRPLARVQDKTKRLYDLRRSSYALAKLRVEVTKDKGSEELSTEILALLSS
jgi:shikimate kinase